MLIGSLDYSITFLSYSELPERNSVAIVYLLNSLFLSDLLVS